MKYSSAVDSEDTESTGFSLMIKECEHCKKKFTASDRIRGNPQKYCNIKCQKAARAKRSKKKPLSHVVIYRKIIVNYLGNKCSVCGTTKNLHVHHIIPRFLGGEDKINNLTLLCKTHHEELHSELYKKY